MKPRSFMIIAGEASGDKLGGELVGTLRQLAAEQAGAPSLDYQPRQAALEPEFYGAGGECMTHDWAYGNRAEIPVGLKE